MTGPLTPEQWVGQSPVQTLTYEAACDRCGTLAWWTAWHGSSRREIDCPNCTPAEARRA